MARKLVSGLKKKGHSVIWFSAPEETFAILVEGDTKLLNKDLKIRLLQDLGPEIRSQMSLFGTKMYYEMDLLTRAYNMYMHGKLDILHVFHSSFGHLAHFFEELTGVPTLYTLHDPMPTEDMLEYWLFERFPKQRFLSISKSQQGKLSSHFFGNVYNGADINEFKFNRIPNDSFIAVGRMTQEKGIDIAIQASRKANVKLNIASWISKNVEISEYYKKNIAPYLNTESIKIFNLLSGSKIVSMYQKAKGLIFPLQWEEPFGLVMIEAMACGTPVIAYNRGSVSEIVRDGLTGFIIDSDIKVMKGSGKWTIKKQGIEGLVEAIRRIGEIDRANCRRHIEKNFTI
ncbi:glycosyltransferase, partial [Candidatus Roizmanbacteria bacterium]|nr:glycosyltransferase [Candidatus Roizmanbacteria bacterium]